MEGAAVHIRSSPEENSKETFPHRSDFCKGWFPW